MCGHLLAALERDDMDLFGSLPFRGHGNVDGDVASAYDDHFFADAGVPAEVHVSEKVKAPENTVEVGSGEGDPARTGKADAYVDGPESFLFEGCDGKIPAQFHTGFYFNAEIDDVLYVPVKVFLGQAVFRYAVAHGA